MLKEKLKLVPNNPGCYLMKNNNNEIIYVGKAKNLKNRLSSYFNGIHTGKTKMLLDDITDFEYIITNKEKEALILEINLIKKYMPKYNILLKDDKSYPYIELTDDKIPILKVVRNINRKKNNKTKLYGPYPNVLAARKTVNMLNRLYPLRKCQTYNKNGCLYYHLGQCLGYCINKIDNNVIMDIKKEIITFLKGDYTLITKKIETEMLDASNNMNYEKALQLKELLNDIKITVNNQKVELTNKDDLDVFGYSYKEGYLSIQVFYIRGGKLLGRTSNIYEIVDDIEESLTYYILNFYNKDHIKPKLILIPSIIDNILVEEILNIKVSIPKKGQYKNIIDMVNNNAKINLDNELITIKKNNDNINKALNSLCNILNISKADKIEIFDNSNLFGSFYVSGMVVYENGLPNKNLYRKYKINLDYPDDLKAMEEVIYRRYFKVIKDDLIKPDLVIVDGGKNQLNITKNIINDLNLNIPVIGLKKDNKHHTSSIIKSNNEEVIIDKRDPLFILLNNMQDEVHRFSIYYHKDLRSKGLLASVLDVVPGIGEKRKKELLKKYKTINKIKSLSKEELTTILPEKVANDLQDYLKTMVEK
jgi:excinuclease ABC subunit C